MNFLKTGWMLVLLGSSVGCAIEKPKLNHQFEFINNDEICVGVDMNAGGAIAFL